MKLCFPVEEICGLESKVYGHFGSAPAFVVVDTKTNTFSTIHNNDQRHAHGACNPIRALGNHEVDAIIVGGIGGGALSGLNEAGIRVYRAGAARIRENISMFAAEQLPEYTLQECCGGHSYGGGCAH
jgi:predicted Fe-Mo cluster-binding NifX family protein